MEDQCITKTKNIFDNISVFSETDKEGTEYNKRENCYSSRGSMMGFCPQFLCVLSEVQLILYCINYN